MNRVVALAGASALAFFSSPASAQSEAANLAAKFGALEGVKQASLSPGGDKVAFISEAVEGSRVYVADLATGGQPKIVLTIPRTVGHMSSCLWTAATRLVCRARFVVKVEDTLVPTSRLYAVDSNATNFQQLTLEGSRESRGFQADGGQILDVDVAGHPGVILLARRFLPDDRIGSNLGSDRSGYGVDQIDTATLKRKTVEPPREDAVEYISDGRGNVRILGTMGRTPEGYLRGSRSYSFRKPNTREWSRLSTVTEGGDGFDPAAIDPATNLAYGLDNDQGFKTLFSVTLDDEMTRKKVLGHPGADIDGIVAIGRQRRIVGATYATDRRVIEYFDPALKALSTSLQRALPGSPAVDIAGASQDESKLLVLASRDTMPGQFYVFDKSTKQLAEVLPVRPDLKGVRLATMKPVTFPAADGTAIPGYLTLPPGMTSAKNLPAIVMPHGGPSARDEWGFDWLSQFFAARGYAVLQPNYRGSSGYGSAFFLNNGFKSWRTAIGDVNDAGRWLVAQGIAAPDKLAIVGWSYGGYAALQSAVLDPSLFKAIVAVAPVTDLARLKADAAQFINGPSIARMVGDGPHVREGSPAQNAARITAPVLMFMGDLDMNVAVNQPRLMHRKLKDAGKDVTYVEFPGLEHQLYDAAARTRMLADSDAFLRKNLGLPAD